MISVDIVLPRKSFDITLNELFGVGITGVFGPSGSGKSSLLNAVAGLTIPDRGCIVINGCEVFNAASGKNVPVHQRRIGYVFQDGRLFPHMTVEKNLRYGIDKHRDNILGFGDVVDLLKLGHILDSRPAVISGGEYQRVALGRALLSSPQVLLLDEPFSAIDAALRSQIIPYLLDLHRQISIPMLVVSHEITDLLKLTNRLCILRAGRCVGYGEYESLLGTAAVTGLLKNGSVPNAIGAFLVGLPFMVKSVQTARLRIDNALIEAAATLGKRGPVIFFSIVVPNLKEGIATGLLLSFGRSLGEVGISLMLGGNIIGRTETLSLAIYNAVFEGDFRSAVALSLLLSVVAIGVTISLSVIKRWL